MDRCIARRVTWRLVTRVWGLGLLRGYPETSRPHCIALKPPSDDNEKQD